MIMKDMLGNLFFLLAGIIALTCVVSGCEKELDLNLPVTPSSLVVEGWIENGRNAEIILSHSAPYFSVIDSNSLPDFAETHAKVTLISGSESEILTLVPNQAYFPPFIYRSVEMTGEIDSSYSIEVILSGDTLTATTTIPEPVFLDSVWFSCDPGLETKGRIWIRLNDNKAQDNYYRILYKRKDKDNKYIAPNLSTFSDRLFNGETVDLGFLRGFSSMIAVEEENYFEVGDTVSVKFCTIDNIQFEFWNVYQNQVLAAANPLATSNNQLKSNVKGGLGIWTGYGATYYLIYAK
jgi:hypothetical protein